MEMWTWVLADKGKQNPTVNDNLILIFEYAIVSVTEDLKVQEDNRLKQKYSP